MSANKNPDSVHGQGEFHNRVPRSEPLTTKGHAPGVLVGNGAAPEFHAETHPAGSAPASSTFKPNPVNEVPGQALNPAMQSGTAASDTLPGATSADVHQGYGHPGSGMTSQELHGKHSKDGAGLEGVGANPSDPISQMGADRDHATGHRGVTGSSNAEDREGAHIEQVASERR